METLFVVLSNFFTLTAFGAFVCELGELAVLGMRGSSPQRTEVLLGGVFVIGISLVLGLVFYGAASAAGA